MNGTRWLLTDEKRSDRFAREIAYFQDCVEGTDLPPENWSTRLAMVLRRWDEARRTSGLKETCGGVGSRRWDRPSRP